MRSRSSLKVPIVEATVDLLELLAVDLIPKDLSILLVELLDQTAHRTSSLANLYSLIPCQPSKNVKITDRTT